MRVERNVKRDAMACAECFHREPVVRVVLMSATHPVPLCLYCARSLVAKVTRWIDRESARPTPTSAGGGDDT